MKALAFDLGSSGGKFLSGNFDGKILELKEIHRFNNDPVERDGHFYWDIPRIYSNLLAGLKRSVSEKISPSHRTSTPTRW